MSTSPLSIPTGSYVLADPRASCRRLVNCFIQAAPQLPQLGENPADAKQKTPPVVLRRAAGITGLVSDGTSNPVRGMWMMNGVLYAVIGPTLYSVSTSWALTNVGTGITGAGFVRMRDNGACLTILIPSSTTAYTYTTGAGLAAITATGFTSLGAIDLGYLDTFMVFLQQNGQGVFNDDGRAVSGTGPITFTTPSQFLREFGTDLFVGMTIDHRAITAYGAMTSETYMDVGNAVGSPLASNPDGFLEIGLAAPYALGVQDQAPHWLANDRTVRRKSGQTPIRVSQHGIENILQTADLTGAYVLTFSYEGHLFWALTMPASTVLRTLVLDITTGEWHELSSQVTGYWRPMCALQAYGKQLVGDSQGGIIGFLDSTVSTEFGDPQTMSWTHQPVYQQGYRISHRRVELFMGAGLAAVSMENPTINMEVSDDGGETFRSFPTRNLGMQGEYTNRVVWTNCGTSRQRVYQFSITDALLATWVPDLQIDAQIGRY